MLPTDRAARTAQCSNVANCTKAESREFVEWYPGAGEYCPECGEALAPGPAPPAADSATFRVAASAAVDAAPARSNGSAAGSSSARNGTPSKNDAPRLTAAKPRPASTTREARYIFPPRWFWILGAALCATAAIVYATYPDAARQRVTVDDVTVCPVSSAHQFVVDLVRGYAAQSGTRADRFVVTNAKPCDVRFSMTPETPDDVIAHDAIVAIVNPHNPISRISETQLRLIFSGSIHDWSELGMPPGPIVAILPEAGSDEAKALASWLFFGVSIDRAVRRGHSSADVTAAVTGSDAASRNAIGLVTFSATAAAKVVPLTNLPEPSVLSIASGRYPYTLAITVRAASAHSAGDAEGLLTYARSSDGAAILVKNGLVPRKR
jgi:hypothetical protein